MNKQATPNGQEIEEYSEGLVHEDAYGGMWKLTELSDTHLCNIVNYLPGSKHRKFPYYEIMRLAFIAETVRRGLSQRMWENQTPHINPTNFKWYKWNGEDNLCLSERPANELQTPQGSGDSFINEEHSAGVRFFSGVIKALLLVMIFAVGGWILFAALANTAKANQGVHDDKYFACLEFLVEEGASNKLFTINVDGVFDIYMVDVVHSAEKFAEMAVKSVFARHVCGAVIKFSYSKCVYVKEKEPHSEACYLESQFGRFRVTPGGEGDINMVFTSYD